MGLLVPAARGQYVAQHLGQRDSQPGTGWGTTITASATPHSLGTITQLVASMPIEAEWLRVMVQNTSTATTNTNYLLNLYIGAASSEVLFIDSLQVGWTPGWTAGRGEPSSFWFPVRIPRGTRISAAGRALIASDTVVVSLEYGVSNGAHWVGSGVETLGEDTANSRGTSSTPATAAPTWATIGTTGRRYKYLVPSMQGNADTSLTAEARNIVVGTGSAMLQNMGGAFFSSSTDETWNQHNNGWWCDVPSGTSLQARQWSASGIEVTYVALHGVY